MLTPHGDCPAGILATTESDATSITLTSFDGPEPEATLRGLLSHAAPPNAKGPFEYNPERYGTLKSAKFVNGVLDALARRMGKL